MEKCELSHFRFISVRMPRNSGPEYRASPPKPASEYPTGEHNSTAWKPASASCLSVPGKSRAIILRTGYVWHPIGRPSGFARNGNNADTDPAAAVWRSPRRVTLYTRVFSHEVVTSTRGREADLPPRAAESTIGRRGG